MKNSRLMPIFHPNYTTLTEDATVTPILPSGDKFYNFIPEVLDFYRKLTYHKKIG
jgi:hypothetical protein